MSGSFPLLVLTPDKVIVNEEVESVMLTAIDGALQITPGRWPVVTVLKADYVCYRQNHNNNRVAVQGGIAVYKDNRLCILTPDAILNADEGQLHELQSRQHEGLDKESELSSPDILGSLRKYVTTIKQDE